MYNWSFWIYFFVSALFSKIYTCSNSSLHLYLQRVLFFFKRSGNFKIALIKIWGFSRISIILFVESSSSHYSVINWLKNLISIFTINILMRDSSDDKLKSYFNDSKKNWFIFIAWLKYSDSLWHNCFFIFKSVILSTTYFFRFICIFID